MILSNMIPGGSWKSNTNICQIQKKLLIGSVHIYLTAFKNNKINLCSLCHLSISFITELPCKTVLLKKMMMKNTIILQCAEYKSVIYSLQVPQFSIRPSHSCTQFISTWYTSRWSDHLII